MKKFIANNWIMIVISFSFLASTILAIRNNYAIERNQVVQQQAELINRRTQEILSLTMHGLDLGVRGYGLTRDEKLLIPYKESITVTASIFNQLDSLLAVQQYVDRDKLKEVKDEVKAYIDYSNQMIDIADANDMERFTTMLKEDRGYKVWSKYNAFAQPLLAFEEKITKESLQNYQNAIRSNLILQVTILLLGLPLLYIFVQQVRKERAAREAVLNEVKKTDETYVFNPGESEQGVVSDINERSIANIKQASEIIESIANGNYEIEWKGLTDKNASLNKRTLAGNLLNLRERLKKVKKEDEKRNWINEGLAKFLDIVRTYQDNTDELFIRSISFLTKYLNAQQGSMFIVDGEEGAEYLKLVACFAFDRKKWIEKKIEIGNGLIGQAFLEGQPIILKQIPEGYTQIRSGLGDATPKYLVIIPMKNNDTTIALVELASFSDLEAYQIDFLQRAGEYLASAIVSTRITAKMKKLLEDSALREQQMREREEELRQNMEELQATQEELVRKQNESSYQAIKKSA